MNEISNRTLATLLIASIVISMAGTLIALQKIGQRITVLSAPTGRANLVNGTARVSIQESLSIVLQTGYQLIDFGTGYINGSTADCITASASYTGVNLTTVGSTGTNQNDCFINNSNGNPALQPTDFRVENDGTVNASVNVRGPANTSLLGSTNPAYQEFSWRGVDDVELGSACQDASLQSTWISFDSNTSLCTDLDWDNADDVLRVEVKLRFPGNQSTGLYTNNSIAFYAVRS